MKSNISYTDRVIRILIAILFVSLYTLKMVTGIPGIILLILACVFILTSVISFCPIYKIFGLSTRSEKSKTIHHDW